MRILRLSVSALFLLTALVGAAPQGPLAARLVEELVVEGNRRLSDEDILRHVRTRPGDRYNPAQVQHDLKTLLELPSFDKTQTRVSLNMGSRGGVVVIFTVAELPVIRDITFPGLRSLSDAEALDVLREGAGIWKEGAFDPVNVKKAERLIKEALAVRGRPHASVQVYVEEVSAQSVVLTFAVEEGPKGLPRGPRREPKPLRPPRKKWLRTPQVARASQTGVEIGTE